ERDVLRLSATLDRDLYAVGRADRVEDLHAALRIVERRAVDRQDEVARLQAQPCELLAITPRVDAIAALHAVREQRLRAQEAGESGRVRFGDTAEVFDDSSRLPGRRPNRRDEIALRQREGFERAAAVENDPVRVYSVQGRAGAEDRKSGVEGRRVGIGTGGWVRG